MPPPNETLRAQLRLARKNYRLHPTEANARECERLYLLCYPQNCETVKAQLEELEERRR